MIELILFDLFWIYMFKTCLLGFRLDTSRMRISFIVRFIPFYKIDFWINKSFEYDHVHHVSNDVYDITIPYLVDARIIKQL